jgi:hypothetical protein
MSVLSHFEQRPPTGLFNIIAMCGDGQYVER